MSRGWSLGSGGCLNLPRPWTTWSRVYLREMQGPLNIALERASQIEPTINNKFFERDCLLDSAFKDDDRDFDSEGMFSLNDAVDFNTALQSLFREFLNLNVDFIHARVTNVGFGLADATDEADHGRTAIIPAQRFVERALDKSCLKGVNLEETLREVQCEVMVRVPGQNDSRVFELLSAKPVEMEYHDHMLCLGDDGIGDGGLF